MNKYLFWSWLWFAVFIFCMYLDDDIYAVGSVVNSTIWSVAGTLRRDIK